MSRSFDDNPYYSPEKCGLVVLGQIETGEAYEFCTTLAFKDIETGEILLAQDSGCSCPTPFENFKTISDMIPYTDDDQVRRLVDFHNDDLTQQEVRTFCEKIHEAQSE